MTTSITHEWIVHVDTGTSVGVLAEKFLGTDKPSDALKLARWLQTYQRIVPGEIVDLHRAGDPSFAEKVDTIRTNEKFHLACYRAFIGDAGTKINERGDGWGKRLRLHISAEGEVLSKKPMTNGMADPPSMERLGWDILPRPALKAIRSITGNEPSASIRRVFGRGQSVRVVEGYDARQSQTPNTDFFVDVDDFREGSAFNLDEAVKDLVRLVLSTPTIRHLSRSANPAVVRKATLVGSEVIYGEAREILRRPRPAAGKLPPLPGEPGFTLKDAIGE